MTFNPLRELEKPFGSYAGLIAAKAQFFLTVLSLI